MNVGSGIRMLRSHPRLRLVPVGVVLATLAALGVVAGTTPASSAGYSAKVTNSTDTAATGGAFTCATAVSQDVASNTALFDYPFTDASQSAPANAADISGKGNKGTYVGTGTTDSTTPLACPRDTGAAYTLDGKTSYVYGPAVTAANSPTAFTLEVWFTTTQYGGKLFTYGNQSTTASGTYDRHVYLNNAGRLVFGVYNGGALVITSPLAYNDGKWHHMALTFTTAYVATMYVDGAVVASGTLAAAESHAGYWRIGYDTLGGAWPGSGTTPSGAAYNPFFLGSLRYAAVYTTVLTAAQIASDYAAGH